MDPTFDSKFVRYAVNHVNDDHHDAMLVLLKAHTNNEKLVHVQLLDYDSISMQVLIKDKESNEETVTIPFPQPLKNAQEFRSVLIAMIKSARID